MSLLPSSSQNAKNTKHALRDPTMMWNTAHPPGTQEGYTPVHGGKVARRANVRLRAGVYVRACAGEWKKRVTHGTYARQCMLALLPFLAPPPHPPRPPCNAIPRVRMYNGSTARESQRRAIYPLLFAFAGRQRTERTSTTRPPSCMRTCARDAIDEAAFNLQLPLRSHALPFVYARSTVCLSHP